MNGRRRTVFRLAGDHAAHAADAPLQIYGKAPARHRPSKKLFILSNQQMKCHTGCTQSPPRTRKHIAKDAPGAVLGASFRETQKIYPGSRAGSSGNRAGRSGLDRENAGIDHERARPAGTGQSHAQENQGGISKI
jgi:hypothetical protein